MKRPARWIAALLLGLIVGALLFASAGPSLGLYLGALGWVAICAPYLALLMNDPRHAGASPVAVRRLLGRHQLPFLFVVGVGFVWLFVGPVSAIKVLRCFVVLLAFCALLVELTPLLLRLMPISTLAAGIATCLGLLWLCCPIWLSHLFQSPQGQKTANLLVAVHPLFVINGVVASLGAWPEQSLAYHLTNVGQDVSYALPASIWPAVLFHAILALLAAASNVWADYGRAQRA